MAQVFNHHARAEGVLITLRQKGLFGSKTIEPNTWSQASARLTPAVRYLSALTDNGDAHASEDGLLIVHDAISSMPATIADLLQLPPLGTLSITLAFDGIMTDPRARIRVSWYDVNDSRIAIRRMGSIAQWGNLEGRLSTPLLALADAIDAYNATENGTPDARIAAWAPVQAALSQVSGDEVKSDDSYLTTLTIYQAGAIALDVLETDMGPDFLPVMMGREKVANLNDDTSSPEGDQVDGETRPERDLIADALLPKNYQNKFARELFAGEAASRDAYVLDRNTFLVLDPSLKTALDVIRRKRRASKAERIAFLKNPRAEIAEALGDETGETAYSIVVETHQYSERVLGLGIWEPPATPWLKSASGQWLPERFPFPIGDQVIELDRTMFAELKAATAKACDDGLDIVAVDGHTFRAADVQQAFSELGLDVSGSPKTEETADTNTEELPSSSEPNNEQRLVIRQNLDGKDYSVAYVPRDVAIGLDLPGRPLVSTLPKSHQIAGFDWLVSAYKAGWPGVLLADDMGLGKTFQALAFLAWIRQNRIALGIGRGAKHKPILIVAPTALLRNWAEEAERHLGKDVLGKRIDAFGTSIRRLKTEKSDQWSPETALDVAELRRADWILTTYETLADNHRAFARVACSIVVFDEAQKIKAPGSINTQSAKSINAEFVLAMTGTPIENRLSDLWCIMDRVVPGYLGDNKSFANQYENGDNGALRQLKSMLDAPLNDKAPSVLLRRMKTEILEGLPKRETVRHHVTMPEEQALAYHQAVAKAQAGSASQGDMLRAIHAFRGISLHPFGATRCDPFDKVSVREWISKSARMLHAFQVLDEIRHRGEKALAFVEDLEIQALLASATATYFDMERQPGVINGSVPGERRLEIVDRFQKAANGFDILLLSPKAAGIGLTITAANHVIHLSRWWNPAVEDQCNDRCYRIGQQKDVTVHLPIAVHPDYGDSSFDIRLDALLERKRKLSRDMLLPPISEGDVSELFGQTVGHL